MDRRTGRHWRQATGGRIPRKRGAPSGRYLSLEERLQIADLHLAEATVSAIATEIGRSASTVSREVTRNGPGPAGQYGARVQDWRTVLDGAAREALPGGGMRVRLPIVRAGQLTSLVVAEQRCCPFFTFRLTLAGDHVELEARVPTGAEPLVADLFGAQVSSC